MMEDVRVAGGEEELDLDEENGARLRGMFEKLRDNSGREDILLSARTRVLGRVGEKLGCDKVNIIFLMLVRSSFPKNISVLSYSQLRMAPAWQWTCSPPCPAGAVPVCPMLPGSETLGER